MRTRLVSVYFYGQFLLKYPVMQHKLVHKNSGTCSTAVAFRLEGGRVYEVEFDGGCSGNLQAVARLAEGMEVEEVLRRLKGIRCGDKSTSCPDQLARALEGELSKA